MDEKPQPRVMACENCNVALVPIQKTANVSIAGLFGVMVFLVAIPVFFLSPVISVVMIIVALLVSITGRAKVTLMLCPSCGKSKKI